MAKICSWCGNKIGFLEIDHYEAVGDEDYCICGECSDKIFSAKKGQIALEEIVTEHTAPKLFDYFSQQIKAPTEQEQIKKEAQQTNPLYDDIHQIAGDLRFIKNWLIFCIVVGCIIGFFYFAAIFSQF